MKKYLWLCPLVVLAVGCAHKYDIVTTTGAKLVGVTKPVLHQDTEEYFFTDAQGRQMAIKAVRVSVIEPHEEAKKNKKPGTYHGDFNSSGYKAEFR